MLSGLAGECVEYALDNLELTEELLGNTRGGGGVGCFFGGRAGGVAYNEYGSLATSANLCQII